MASDADVRRRNMMGIAEDAPLWRVFRLEYLATLVRERENVLTKPECWEDPFEAFMGRCKLVLKPSGTRISLSGLYTSYYGQCWSKQESDSDATWRIYAPAGQRGARVRVRAGNLFSTIFHPSDHHRSLKAFLGPVQYLSEQDIHDFVVSEGASATLDPSTLSQAKLLMIKRHEFEHEEEVRLLYSTMDAARAIDKLRRFSVDPVQLIEEIVLDPRLALAEAADREQELQSFGYTGSVRRSKLYSLPSFPDDDRLLKPKVSAVTRWPLPIHRPTARRAWLQR